MQRNYYAVIEIGMMRAGVPHMFQTIRRLFPDEHAFIPLDQIEESTTEADSTIPTYGFDSMLRL
jgi:hypothetical protein